MNQSLERLSSGFRVNNASDDAAGFAIASKLDAQTQRLKAASMNATQAQAMVKMAEAGINEIQNMVTRIQTLATQGASANNSQELGKLDAERAKLEGAIDKISASTNYNGVSLLNGSAGATASVGAGATGVSATVTVQGAPATGASHAYTLENVTTGASNAFILKDTVAGTQQAVTVATPAVGNTTTVSFGSMGLSIDFDANIATFTAQAVTVTAGAAQDFQVGADNNVNNVVQVSLDKDYSASGLGLSGSALGAMDTVAEAKAYIDTAKTALNTLISNRADLGATQNQLGFINANLATSIEQATASVSSIKDADMAAEMAQFTKNQILVQAGTSMLAQANQAAQNVLSLFR
ncbi:flagellin N-terminal helical domain-containing protein [Mariprofundus micogutta]